MNGPEEEHQKSDINPSKHSAKLRDNASVFSDRGERSQEALPRALSAMKSDKKPGLTFYFLLKQHFLLEPVHSF